MNGVDFARFNAAAAAARDVIFSTTWFVTRYSPFGTRLNLISTHYLIENEKGEAR
jgi:hypothetical protein